ncbi:MAG: phenylalanine--tRNA ligase subunit beta [Actinomycetota bacterium]|nr:phenylalanine--tRNA ligase subunit beta [Actinomycetota bacterium]
MRVPLSWLREHVDLPAGTAAAEVAARLTMAGLKLESLETPGHDICGPLVVGQVVSFEVETHQNGKTVRWCQVEVGPYDDAGEPRGIVCGADNFDVGDVVVVALPGAVLPGGFVIAARKTYGHVSDGMICSASELGSGEDSHGIVVLGGAEALEADEVKPGDDAIELLQLRDEVIEFEINPDRAYALSVRGVAREAATAFDLPFTDPAEAEPVDGNGPGYPVAVDAPDACPVFAACSVTGFDPRAATPGWLVRRVQLAGMRPISLAVDVTNYVMLELGQPIHGYDRDRLTGPIVVRRAGHGERLRTLDGTTRELHREDLLITDDSGPIGLAGVMGGEATEIGPQTTDLVIEGAHFAPVPVARTARRHKLPSEASKRFERGVDPLLPVVAARRVAQLLVRYGGGHIDDGHTVVGTAPPAPTITMAATLPAEVTGMVIDAETAASCLREVGCEVSPQASPGVSPGAGSLIVRPPSWRPDLTAGHDLVEEVARLVGYDRVPSALPPAPAGRGLTRVQRLRRRVGTTLAGAGYVEVSSYPFVGPADWAALGLCVDDPRRRTVRIANPLSDQEPELRTTILPGLLRALARNAGRGQSDAALFESAAVFLPDDGAPTAPGLPVDRRPTAAELMTLEAALPRQPRHLAVVLAGRREPSGWWGPGRAASWADAVATVRELSQELGADVGIRAGATPPWHPGRCADVVLAGTVIGHAGELHPNVCKAYGVPARTAAAEIDLDALLAAAPLIAAAPAFSTFPVAKEDVALVVAQDVPAGEVLEALRGGAGRLLESIRLFDVYTGAQIEPGKKSLAFALRFRATDRTLTEAETATARDAAVAAAMARCGAVPRS